jgi:hypothetical protein
MGGITLKTITIVSEINGGVQAWTFDIKEADLIELMEKYDGRGSSICGDVQDITEEIKEIYPGI